MKFKEIIGVEVIEEVERKIESLNLSKKYSIRPVLIYSGELIKNLTDEDYVSKTLCIDNIFH